MRKSDFSLAVAILSLLVLCEIEAYGAKVTGIKRPKAGETVEVLVQYATQPADEQHRRVTDHNGRILAAFKHVPVAHYEVTPEALADLESNPEVVSISPNLPVQGFLDHATASSDYDPLANYYVSIGRGKAYGIGIAIVDSGVSPTNINMMSTNPTRPASSTARVSSAATLTTNSATVPTWQELQPEPTMLPRR